VSGWAPPPFPHVSGPTTRRRLSKGRRPFSHELAGPMYMKKLRLANLGAALSAGLAALVVIAGFFYVIPSPSRGEAFTLVMVLTGCAVSGSRFRR